MVVNATAWHGDSASHVPISEQEQQRHVFAGGSWGGTMNIPTNSDPSTDQISAQALSFIQITDPLELPAVLGRANG
ncbi:hypothetical protein H9Y04_44765 [Streptomyces sp. TRM66268-LWL]|uniref:Uncharacterized protein n=1 Tax=Streptomyces polyasparticus TaxID=2767826 RepID=A0ABR7SVS8_9ACTN|nr:hypothetical protein [Streptomyces polyasparticus]MBC9719610.1 hypothetical protein [Streptomyces polyasparticus]